MFIYSGNIVDGLYILTPDKYELYNSELEPIKEETQFVNLGVDDEPKMVQIGNTLTSSKKDALVTLLKKFKEIFAWSYKDMPKIDIAIVQH